jgi:hypothetical protein
MRNSINKIINIYFLLKNDSKLYRINKIYDNNNLNKLEYNIILIYIIK